MNEQIIDLVLQFPAEPDEIVNFSNMNSCWETALNARIEFPDLSKTQLKKYISFIKENTTYSITSIIADAIAESDLLDSDDMFNLDEIKDIELKCTLALRKNLPDSLRKKYLMSENDDIFRSAAFNPKTTLNELYEMLPRLSEYRKWIIERKAASLQP